MVERLKLECNQLKGSVVDGKLKSLKSINMQEEVEDECGKREVNDGFKAIKIIENLDCRKKERRGDFENRKKDGVRFG